MNSNKSNDQNNINDIKNTQLEDPQADLFKPRYVQRDLSSDVSNTDDNEVYLYQQNNPKNQKNIDQQHNKINLNLIKQQSIETQDINYDSSLTQELNNEQKINTKNYEIFSNQHEEKTKSHTDTINFIINKDNRINNTVKRDITTNTQQDTLKVSASSETEKSQSDLSLNPNDQSYTNKISENTENVKVTKQPTVTKSQNDPILAKIFKGCVIKLIKFFGCLLFIISITIILLIYIINF